MNNLQAPIIIEGIAAVIEKYRAVILDLWGVLHDGNVASPHAITALDALRNKKIDICLLSNSPRRAYQVAKHLKSMGIEPSQYNYIVTSGELVYKALENASDDWHRALAARYFHIGPPELAGLLRGLDRFEVFSPRDADFILTTGGSTQPPDEVAALLKECASRKLPMVCANPDLVVLVGDQLVVCAGALAEQYEALGGEVFYHGKPYSSAYRSALDLLGYERHEVLAVGDSLRTDVAGGRNEGMDVLFIASGIHRDAADDFKAGKFPSALLQQVFAGEPVVPTFAASQFRW
ncbi:HAD-superfamily hydrolase, subfamily IIA (plasmid) [Mesorhizobium loti]|uniref:TIGR01459 family HAD-type hydrolase n=1 Tax=Mesorhizobium TaxID=68287 RepID=UPI0005C8F007|nr:MULTISPECIES: TIGR01459 family HAD-type hydrolase [Mesorhizobium]BAV52718.1 HAD-superfamily hydrolase, subfamily IIA [Mesorhizobium loti]BCH04917.1 haloacid dehalogenase [Mesorhizobium sp. 131-2-5]